eukprot:gene17997-21471_t
MPSACLRRPVPRLPGGSQVERSRFLIPSTFDDSNGEMQCGNPLSPY